MEKKSESNLTEGITVQRQATFVLVEGPYRVSVINFSSSSVGGQLKLVGNGGIDEIPEMHFDIDAVFFF